MCLKVLKESLWRLPSSLPPSAPIRPVRFQFSLSPHTWWSAMWCFLSQSECSLHIFFNTTDRDVDFDLSSLYMFIINIIIFTSMYWAEQSPAQGDEWTTRGRAGGQAGSRWGQKYFLFFGRKQIRKMCHINHYNPAAVTFILKITDKKWPLTLSSVLSLILTPVCAS